MNRVIFSMAMIFISFPIFSYVGPGMSGGFIAAVLGFIIAIFLVLWAILYYPIKRALNKIRVGKNRE
jgi:hypothetical protein